MRPGKSKQFALSIILPSLVLGCASAGAQIFPQRGLYDESTGLVETRIGRDWYRGSGVITRDPRLVYSCAHLLHEDGLWAGDCIFHCAWHSASAPSSGTGMAARGFHYFTSYAPNAAAYGGDSERAYQYDFAIFYHGAGFGRAVGWWPDGGAALRSNGWKFIAGYPSRLSHTRANGYYFQHATDWFDIAASQVRSPYHQFDGVSTGVGNSGGPVFVWDDGSKDHYLAGILVSGDSSTSGVRALDGATNNLATAALGARKITRSFTNTSSTWLPDGASNRTNRNITAVGFSGNLNTLKCSVDIRTSRRGDLEVFLRAPSGRIRWLLKPSASTKDNLILNNADLTAVFKGQPANGNWSLRMRDTRRPGAARFMRFSLSISAPGM